MRSQLMILSVCEYTCNNSLLRFINSFPGDVFPALSSQLIYLRCLIDDSLHDITSIYELRRLHHSVSHFFLPFQSFFHSTFTLWFTRAPWNVPCFFCAFHCQRSIWCYCIVYDFLSSLYVSRYYLLKFWRSVFCSFIFLKILYICSILSFVKCKIDDLR